MKIPKSKNLPFICALLSLGVCASNAWAQPQPSWIFLDESQPGTPADVTFEASISDASRSFINVVIHGFWVEPKVGPDGQVYSKLSVPGLGTITQTGAPSLPTGRFDLAIATGSTSVQLESVNRLGVQQFGGMLVWPQPIHEMDDHGTPEQFRRDDSIYRLERPWPFVDGAGTERLQPKLGSINGITTEVYPFHWNPTSRLLTVDYRVRYGFIHPGNPQTQRPMTRERDGLANLQFINWPVASLYNPVNLLFYEADFLFIYPPGYQTALLPLINQKKARGFTVTELTTDQTGTTCDSIRAAMRNWYDSLILWSDKYALLVGDVNVIPLCISPFPYVPTDHLYANPHADSLDPEIHLGRLAVSSQSDAADQVGKILQYEDHPAIFCCYDQVLLVANKEDAPGKYVGAHESVRTATYSVPPTFQTFYGHQFGVNNAGVTAAINGGPGLVAYRGHGDEVSWWNWDLSSENYSVADVAGLTNDARQGPVVWSFACSNSDLTTANAIAKVWMSDGSHRAVSHYGATVPSNTVQNHELDRRMFKAVYDLGKTTQSHAIQYGEKKMRELVGPENAWMYVLLGDPDMQIRRRNPYNWSIVTPIYLTTCEGCPPLSINVSDELGNPVDVLVSAWKAVGDSDELHANRYTDANGQVQIPVSSLSAGDLYFTVQDRAGNTFTDVIQVVSP